MPSANLSSEAAEMLGFRAGTPVVGGGGDQAAGGVGSGVVESGLVSSSLGTSGVVFAHADRPFVDPQLRTHTFCHAVPGKWHVMGVVISAGGSLRWYRDTFCEFEKEQAARQGIDPYELITSSAGVDRAGCEGLFIFPTCPANARPIRTECERSVLRGDFWRNTKAHFSRAVLEGVASR